ncbi:hypothetical protein ACFO0M_17560 [Micromonospora mangrovi]|uniref:Uncharacterized protein n=2 Tax=Micromonospora TaxID=1873 RepID=A0AAU7MBC6_9ACTN
MPELFAHLGEMGLVGLVKIDRERKHKPWTVVITGQRLNAAAIRVDGNSLDYCLRYAVAALRERFPDETALGFPPLGRGRCPGGCRWLTAPHRAPRGALIYKRRNQQYVLLIRCPPSADVRHASAS